MLQFISKFQFNISLYQNTYPILKRTKKRKTLVIENEFDLAHLTPTSFNYKKKKHFENSMKNFT